MPATPTVLAIDDNATIRKAVAMRLVAKGFEVVTAADGESGLALVEQRPFDVILLDLVMPGMRGDEVLRRLRDRYPATDLPVIMLAASGNAADIQRSLDLGANDYIVKPGHLPTLVARIHTQLALRDTLASLRAQTTGSTQAWAKSADNVMNSSSGDGLALPYALLYEHAPGNSFTLTSAGVVRHVSQHAAEALGYRPDMLLGHSFADLYRVADRRQIEAHLARARQFPDRVHHWEMHQIMENGERVRMRHLGRALDVGGDMLLLVACENIDDAWKLGRRLALQSRHDPLTGLVNRQSLEQRMHQLLDNPPGETPGHALAVIEIDEFKLVNDSCGKAAGDDLLRHVARQLKTLARGRDTVARIGGDEFAMLIEDCSLEAARSALDGVHRIIAVQDFEWQSRRFRLSVSIGLVMLEPGAASPGEMLGMADAARYAARESGRNRVHVYQDDDAPIKLRQGTIRRAARFAQALHDDQFMLAVQPISALKQPKTGMHCEILVRMRDELGQLIMPGEFLAVAERYKLAASLDRWVISHTFDWLRERTNAGLAVPAMCAINLSGQSIGNNELLGYILEQFTGNGIRASSVCFEITETAAIADLAHATRFMRTLKEQGCHFALDDFGSGYSSLTYLKQLPVDFLKIDGAFVRDMATHPLDYAMVRSINDIGHVMGKQTIAEFVENAQTLQLLHELSIDFAQGYAIGRPQPLETLIIE